MTYKRLKASCLDCKKEISKSNFDKHLDSIQCKKQPRQNTKLECPFCSKLFNRLHKHESFCTQNPDRIKRKGKNQFTKARELGLEYVVSEETRQKLKQSNIGRKHSEESKKTISKAMKKAVEKYPESYSGGYNRGRVKSLVCSNGFVVLGEWERSFVEFCLEHNIKIEQPNTGFSYQWDGDRTYFPDFYLPETNQWVEIKGLQTERDLAKWESLRNTHKKDLLVIKSVESIRLELISAPL
jgi:hypothetical protein